MTNKLPDFWLTVVNQTFYFPIFFFFIYLVDFNP